MVPLRVRQRVSAFVGWLAVLACGLQPHRAAKHMAHATSKNTARSAYAQALAALRELELPRARQLLARCAAHKSSQAELCGVLLARFLLLIEEDWAEIAAMGMDGSVGALAEVLAIGPRQRLNAPDEPQCVPWQPSSTGVPMPMAAICASGA